MISKITYSKHTMEINKITICGTVNSMILQIVNTIGRFTDFFEQTVTLLLGLCVCCAKADEVGIARGSQSMCVVFSRAVDVSRYLLSGCFG